MEVSAAYADWLTNFLLTSLLAYMLYVLLSIIFTFRQQELSLTRAQKTEGQIQSGEEKDISEEDESFELEGTELNVGDIERIEDIDMSSKKEDGDRHSVKKGSSDSLATVTVVDSPEESEKIAEVINDKRQKVENENIGESLADGIVKESDTRGTPALSIANEVSLRKMTEGDQVGNQDATEFGSQSKSIFPESSNSPSLVTSSLVEGSLNEKREISALEEEWEGVETSEIEDDFDAAATFVGSLAIGQGTKITQEMQLGLYGLYKQATVGPCSTPQPSVLNMSGRAKWNAWKRLGDMKTEDAMEAYIHLVETICPGWSQQEGTDSKQGENRSKMGPVFSTLSDETAGEEGLESGGTSGMNSFFPMGNVGSLWDRSLQALQASASEGDVLQLQKLLKEGCAIDGADEEGRTPLHWAADRGHLEVARLLLAAGASVDKRANLYVEASCTESYGRSDILGEEFVYNPCSFVDGEGETAAYDAEGQTALHYATICGHKAMAEELLKYGADPLATDMEGTVPDLSGKNWQISGKKDEKLTPVADTGGGK